EPRSVLGAVGVGAGDELGAETEPRRDRQGVALPRLVVAQAEGRRERRGVELDRRVARARVRGGEGLERLEMRRRDHQGAALGELLENRLGEGRALVRVGPGAELVEE